MTTVALNGPQVKRNLINSMNGMFIVIGCEYFWRWASTKASVRLRGEGFWANKNNRKFHAFAGWTCAGDVAHQKTGFILSIRNMQTEMPSSSHCKCILSTWILHTTSATRCEHSRMEEPLHRLQFSENPFLAKLLNVWLMLLLLFGTKLSVSASIERALEIPTGCPKGKEKTLFPLLVCVCVCAVWRYSFDKLDNNFDKNRSHSMEFCRA